MKYLIKMRFLPLLLAPLLVVMMVAPATLMAYGPTVDLLSTSQFAVLAGTSITSDGTAVIINGGAANGNVGTPGTFAWLGPVTMDGGTQISGTVATTAMTDLVTVYNDAAGRTPTETFSGADSLTGRILTTGVYAFTSGATDLSGTLTLDAQGDPNAVFIFQAGSTLITGPGSSVNLINGARFCRVFWVVPSSATLGSGSTFVGHIFATASITAGSGATVQGQLLAQTSVFLFGNTITNGICATTSGILTIFKVDSSGNPIVASTPALSTGFNIYTSAADVGVNPPYQEGSTIADTNFFRVSLPNGTYYVTEKSAPAGYSIDSTVRTVTMSGGDASLTFVNGPTGGGASKTITAETTAAETITAETTVTTTVTGGQIPITATPWYNVLIAGAALILIGAVGLLIIRKKIYV
jgi:hypothetical protein